jgi:N-acetylglucosaminyldiphosphoundecaprenol N-acetyl-beta-D-mannosaminyltransferase
MMGCKEGPMPDALSRVTVLDLPLVCSSFAQAAEALLAAARQREGGGAFFCNVHMSVEAREHPALRRALGRCRWIMPDGRPLSLAMRLLGHRASEQVAGPHMTEHLLARAEDENLRVFLYGGTEEQLVGLQRVIALRHPRLVVAGAISPPFRPLGQEDLSLEAEHLAQIEASGAQLCFVGLGCPKQEL